MLERLSRNRVLRRRLPNGVPIYVSPDAQLKYLGSQFDRDLVELAKTRVAPGDTVWDIGANCGVYAFSCDKAARVLAVEADPFLADLLRRSVELNGAPVAVIGCAVADRCGVASFTIARRGRASNHLTDVIGSSQADGERSRLTVPTLTLDTLLESERTPPAFVKIDVEGAEMAVLAGGVRLFGDVRPVLWLETTERSHEACRAFLEQRGYRLERGTGSNWLCLPPSLANDSQQAETA
jgi:FkbM family methyltransferase